MSERRAIETTFPVRVQLPVQWGEMDSYAHVNNAVYFRWFETARIAYMLELGGMPALAHASEGPILARTECHFKAPLTYPDAVEVSIGVVELGRSSFRMAIRVDSAGRGRAAEGDATMVWYDYESAKPTPLPAAVRDGILALEGSADL